MKVKELIEKLKKFNQNAIIFVGDDKNGEWIDIGDVEETSTNIVTIGLD